MKKGIALIAMLLAAVMMLSGCNLIGYDAELDGAQVVAKVNDTELTKAEWLTYRDYLASYYQEYYQQYFGFSMPMDEETIASYGESALEQMIESTVVNHKMEELGLSPLSEEEVAEVESYADEMVDLYKMLVRFQNYPELETVEEEQERLAAEAAEAAETADGSEATETDEAAEPVATITNAQLDEMLLNDLNIIGYNREYFVQSQTASVLNDKIYAHATEGVEVTDEQVKTEFDEQVAAQKESYDANPAAYASAVNAGSEPYYVPAGYRGVKNLLVMISDEKQAEISELKTALTAAQNALDSANADLEEMKAEDTSVLDEEGLAAYNEQIAALEEQAALSQATIDETQPKIDALTEEAFAEILPEAEEALAKAVAGEDFDALVEAYGDDTGMAAEPNKTRGYLVCDGLAMYEQNFQDAAMALANIGDVSAELVETSYGYHILQYATDVAAGEVEYTDEIKEALRATMLTEAQDAAYTAAVTQWVSEAKVETFPKVME